MNSGLLFSQPQESFVFCSVMRLSGSLVCQFASRVSSDVAWFLTVPVSYHAQLAVLPPPHYPAALDEHSTRWQALGQEIERWGLCSSPHRAGTCCVAFAVVITRL